MPEVTDGKWTPPVDPKSQEVYILLKVMRSYCGRMCGQCNKVVACKAWWDGSVCNQDKKFDLQKLCQEFETEFFEKGE